MERQAAEKTCAMVDEIIEKLSLFLQHARQTQTDAAWERTRLAVATCLAELDLEIREPVYREYPDLKPDFLK